ncbi:response regulator transcription factor [Streptomyces lushanensis]|uniref:response regulator transcription factor n=1 Tax=Streptomyces lushanensis TaxID=1434255 RepID=UPI000831D671|nr:response regulator transcription factor [Streptomyces lushanensis]
MSAPRTFSSGHPIRVLLVDGPQTVRHALRDVLDAEPDIRVVADAGSVGEALVRPPSPVPDVAVLDVRWPDADDITACRELRSRMPGLAWLTLTSFDDDTALLNAVLAGASGYVLKQIKDSALVFAVRAVASGRSLLDPAATARLLGGLPARTPAAGTGPPGAPGASAPAVLSPEERHMLRLVGDGLTDRQIGRRLSLTERTVSDRISRLLPKLGIRQGAPASAALARARTPPRRGAPG